MSVSSDHKAITPVEREALDFARKACIGQYEVAHLQALERLKSLGMVRAVQSATGAWYEITQEGHKVLGRAVGSNGMR